MVQTGRGWAAAANRPPRVLEPPHAFGSRSTARPEPKYLETCHIFGGTVVASVYAAMAFCSLRRVSALLGLAVCLQASPADALGRVLSPNTGKASAEHLEVALARAPSRTTLFLRATVSGAASQFGVVVPVAPGSRIDPAAEGFFDALDDATAPRIVPPPATLACGATNASSVDAVLLSDASPTTFPKEVVHAADLGELEGCSTRSWSRSHE